MKNLWRRFLSVLLSVLLVLTSLPVYAEESNLMQLSLDNTYTFTVECVYDDDGSRVDYYSVDAEAGTYVGYDLPQIAGYSAYLEGPDGNPTGYATYYVGTNLIEDVTYTFRYVPGEVNYTVNHVYPTGQVSNEGRTGTTGELTNVGSSITAPEGYIATAVTEQTIAGDGSTIVTVNYKYRNYQLQFVSNGGKYVNPIQFNLGSANITIPSTTRTGYTFSGWKDKNGSVYTAGRVMSPYELIGLADSKGRITLEAVYNATVVSFTVNVWAQNEAGNGYDYEASYTETAEANTTVNSSAYHKTNATFTGKKGFVWNTAKDQNYTIAADGTTVVNV